MDQRSSARSVLQHLLQFQAGVEAAHVPRQQGVATPSFEIPELGAKVAAWRRGLLQRRMKATKELWKTTCLIAWARASAESRWKRKIDDLKCEQRNLDEPLKRLRAVHLQALSDCQGRLQHSLRQLEALRALGKMRSLQVAWCNWKTFVASDSSVRSAQWGAVKLAELHMATQMHRLESVKIQSELAGESVQLAEDVAAAAHRRVQCKRHLCQLVSARVAYDVQTLVWIVVHCWCAMARLRPLDAGAVPALEETIWNLKLRHSSLEEAVGVAHQNRARLLGQIRTTEVRYRANHEKRVGSSRAVALAEKELRSLQRNAKLQAAEVRNIRNTLAKRWSSKEIGLDTLRVELAADECMDQQAKLQRIADQGKLQGHVGISSSHANSFLRRRRLASNHAVEVFCERKSLGPDVGFLRLRWIFDDWRLSARQCHDRRRFQSLSDEFAASTKIHDAKLMQAATVAHASEAAAARAVSEANAEEDALNAFVFPAVRLDSMQVQQRKTAQVHALREELASLHFGMEILMRTLAQEELASSGAEAAEEVAFYEVAASLQKEEIVAGERAAERALEKNEAKLGALTQVREGLLKHEAVHGYRTNLVDHLTSETQAQRKSLEALKERQREFRSQAVIRSATLWGVSIVHQECSSLQKALDRFCKETAERVQSLEAETLSNARLLDNLKSTAQGLVDQSKSDNEIRSTREAEQQQHELLCSGTNPAMHHKASNAVAESRIDEQIASECKRKNSSFVKRDLVQEKQGKKARGSSLPLRRLSSSGAIQGKASSGNVNKQKGVYQNRLQAMEEQLKTLRDLKKQDEIDAKFKEQELESVMGGLADRLGMATQAIERHLGCVQHSFKGLNARRCFFAWRLQKIKGQVAAVVTRRTKPVTKLAPSVVGVDMQDKLLLWICLSIWSGRCSAAAQGSSSEIRKTQALLKSRTRQLQDALTTLEQCGDRLTKEEIVSKELASRCAAAGPAESLEVENLVLKKSLEGFGSLKYKYDVLQLQIQQRGAHLSQALDLLESSTQSVETSLGPSTAML